MKRYENSVLVLKKGLNEKNCIVGIKNSLEENMTLDEKMLMPPFLFEAFSNFYYLVKNILPIKSETILEMFTNASKINPKLKPF